MLFAMIIQTALNVGITIKCTECGKPRFIYAKKPFLTRIQSLTSSNTL